MCTGCKLEVSRGEFKQRFGKSVDNFLGGSQKLLVVVLRWTEAYLLLLALGDACSSIEAERTLSLVACLRGRLCRYNFCVFRIQINISLFGDCSSLYIYIYIYI